MFKISLIQPFVISLILGAFLGFERAFAEKINDKNEHNTLGGIRTFSLISLLGCISAYIDAGYVKGFLVVAFAGILVYTGVQYYISFSKHNERGITTEISILICFSLGVLVQKNLYVQATFVTIMVLVVLYLKDYINKISKRVEPEDLRATIKFAIITFAVLPLIDPKFAVTLGDLKIPFLQNYKSLLSMELIRPYTVWMMVVLISGISFTGYIAIKILGSQKGIGVTGLLGGLVSSTATTITFSKRSQEDARLSLSFSLAVLLACSVMFPRVLVEVLVINAALLPKIAIPMLLMTLSGGITCLIIWKRAEKGAGDEVPLSNPFDISPAVKFGLLYALIVFIAKFVSNTTGSSGLYIVSIISGLTDVDAITLSMSQIAKSDPTKSGQATVAITLAAFSNTMMKAAMAFFLGSKEFRKPILIGFSIIITFGVAGLLLL